MRLAITRSWISVSMLLLVLGVRTSGMREAQLEATVRLSFLAVDRREQLLQGRLVVGQVLILQIGDERVEGRPVGLDAVGPRIAAEIFVNLVDVAGQPRQHVAQRALII